MNRYILKYSFKFENLKKKRYNSAQLFYFGTGILTIKMAAKFEIRFLYSAAINSYGDLYIWGKNKGACLGESYKTFDHKRALVKYQSQSEIIKVML